MLRTVRTLRRVRPLQDDRQSTQASLESWQAARTRTRAAGFSRRQLVHESDSDAFGYDFEGSDNTQQAAHRGNVVVGRAEREHRARLESAENSWEQALPMLEQQALAMAPLAAELRCQRQQRCQQELQALTEAYRSQPLHSCVEGALACAGAELAGSRPIEYRGLDASCTVQVPNFRCSTCHSSFEMPAIAADCFGSSPAQPRLWISLELLRLCKGMQEGAKLDVGAFCSAVQQYSHSLDSQNIASAARYELDDRPFQAAFRWWSILDNHLQDPDTYGTTDTTPGVAGLCPGCCEVSAATPADLTAQQQHASQLLASVQSAFASCPAAAHHADEDALRELTTQLSQVVTVVRAGGGGSSTSDEPGPAEVGPARRPFTVILDGNMKASHYQNCATVASQVQRAHISIFHGAAHRIVQEQSQPQYSPAAAEGAPCPAQLSCARVYASKGGAVTDVKCFMAGMCHHTVPLKGSFLSGSLPECFWYVDVILRQILAERAIGLFVMDTNCRYKVHAAVRLAEAAHGVRRFVIDWLHSKAGHGLPCQLENSGLHADECGRCVGEGCEMFFGAMKPAWPSTRYMSLALRLETIDRLALAFARAKAERLPDQLLSTWRYTKRRTARLTEEATEVRELARVRGLDLREEEPFTLPTVQLDMSKEMEYVKLLEELRTLDAVVNNPTYVAAMEGAAGRTVIAHTLNAAHQRKVADRLQLLEGQLGVTVRWTRDDAQYQEVAAQLRAVQQQALEAEMSRTVSEVTTLCEMRSQEGEAGHTTRLLQARIKARRKRLRDLLATYSMWQRFLLPPLAPEPVACSEDDLLLGRAPWDLAAQSAAMTVEQLRLRLHRIRAELSRCDEELPFLRSDATNVLHYYHHQSAQLCTALAAKLQQLHGSTPSQLVVGEVYMLAARC